MDTEHYWAMKKLLFLLFVLISHKNEGVDATQGCGSVVNNTLKSPRYPLNYPSYTNCLYLVRIPDGMAMKISFNDFNVEYDSTCFYDSLEIINDRNQKFGIYCGRQTGRTITATGLDYVVLIFRSDGFYEEKGFKLFFTPIPVGNATTTKPPSNGCGLVVNNSLKSPGYPNRYPANMDCIYLVPIPKGMTMKVSFKKFSLEYTDDTCGRDFLRITNENNDIPGLHCGQKTGHTVLLAGEVVLMTFHSDTSIEREGFVILFSAVPHVPPEAVLPAPVVTALPGYRLQCSATGSPEINISVMRNNTVLANTTGTAKITLYEQGNYSCVANSKHGIDKKEFPVIFTECDPRCSHLYNPLLKNKFDCLKVMDPGKAIKCAPNIVNTIFLTSSNFSHPPVGVFSHLPDLSYLSLVSNDIQELPAEIFHNLTKLETLLLSSNAISFLPEGLFSTVTQLFRLDLSSNAITVLPDKLFASQANMFWLVLAFNAIKVLPKGIFDSATGLSELNLTSNNIQNITADTLSALVNLQTLYLSSNNIQSITTDVMSHLSSLSVLDLSSNNITSLPADLFSTNFRISTLYLSSNNIQSLPSKLLVKQHQLFRLDLSYNNISSIPTDLFCRCGPRSFRYLFLRNNRISSISKDTFASLTRLIYLFLSANQIQVIPYHAFYNLQRLQIIMLTDNPIKTIEPEAFKLGRPELLNIYLLRTNLRILNLYSFVGLRGLDSQLELKNRTLGTLKYHSGSKSCIIYLNPLRSDAQAVKIYSPTSKANIAFALALMASGFSRKPDNRTDIFYHTYLPCPVGTFSNSTSRGRQGCTPCPPGGFYSDDVGHVAENCKKCPDGSFVAFDKAPGTQVQDCKSCPQGTDTDFFAGYRACKCLEGFYRTDMFSECRKCGQGGRKCQDDYASLKPGYWWAWRNKTHITRYKRFIRNLLASVPELGSDDVKYPYTIPTPYMCPRKESCKGGLESPCEKGYEGPLCAVCSAGYYKQLQTCKQCPSKKWMIVHLSIVGGVLLIIIVFLVWSSKRKVKKDQGRAFLDTFFSKLKIVIGFYQVTYGLLEAFSFIQWPDSLEVIGRYSEILQMNIFQVAPIQCLISGLQVDAFANLFAMMAINAAVICISVVFYVVRKLMILLNRSLDEEEKSSKISETKELMYRNLFFILYVTYLSTCFKTASVLPLACRDLCRDEKEEFCFKYMKADYNIRCQGSKYNQMVIAAYISTAYIFVLPAASFITLWRQRRVILAEEKPKTSQKPGAGMEIITGLRFLFENYNARSWYWELVEMCRKVILTSGLILVGQESRSYIGLAWVIAGMYGVVFSSVSPIQDVVENRLMVTSIAVTVVNLGIGAVSRIPAENVPGSSASYTDAMLFKIMVIGANTMVIGLLVVQYAVHLVQYLKEWRKNPQCSFSCCLAVILPLSDMQGDITGQIGEANSLNNKLEASQVEMPALTSSVKSRVRNTDETIKYCGNNKETQTELFAISTTDIVREVHEEKHEREVTPLSRQSTSDEVLSPQEKLT